MYEMIEAIVGKIDPTLFQFIIVGLAICAAYYLPKVRRDKRGKLYIHSKQYEKVKANGKESAKTLDSLRQGLKRLELLDMLHHAPTAMTAISELYDEYKKLGGNSYVDMLYAAWRETNKEAIKERL